MMYISDVLVVELLLDEISSFFKHINQYIPVNIYVKAITIIVDFFVILIFVKVSVIRLRCQ
jgi:hypothetical protein